MYLSDFQICLGRKCCPAFEMIIFVITITERIMNSGRYIFSQIVTYLPQRQFNRVKGNYTDQISGWSISP